MSLTGSRLGICLIFTGASGASIWRSCFRGYTTVEQASETLSPALLDPKTLTLSFKTETSIIGAVFWGVLYLFRYLCLYYKKVLHPHQTPERQMRNMLVVGSPKHVTCFSLFHRDPPVCGIECLERRPKPHEEPGQSTKAPM